MGTKKKLFVLLLVIISSVICIFSLQLYNASKAEALTYNECRDDPIGSPSSWANSYYWNVCQGHSGQTTLTLWAYNCCVHQDIGGPSSISGTVNLNGYGYTVGNASCAEKNLVGNPYHDCWLFPWGTRTYSSRAVRTWDHPYTVLCLLSGAWDSFPNGCEVCRTQNPYSHAYQSMSTEISNPTQTFEKDEWKEILVWSDGGDNGIVDIQDSSQEGLARLFESNHTQEPYARTTPQFLPTGQEALSDNITVKGTVWNIHKHTDIYTCMGEVTGTKVTYDYTSRSFSQGINYTGNEPKLTNQVWTPLNLNRGGYFGQALANRWTTSSDDSEYGINWGGTVNMGKINGTATNSQSIDNNSFIEGLDINADIPLQLHFNNEAFGLDTGMEWENEPPHYAADDLIMRGESEYAKGYNGHWGPNDDRYRFGTTIWGGVQDIGNNKLTSLYAYDPNEEFIAGTQWTTSLGKDYKMRKTFDKTFGVRAITGGTFRTANYNASETNYPNAWVITWNQGRFFEYGIHYCGWITIGGIQNPQAGTGPYGIVTGQTYGSTPFQLLTSGEVGCRGLYISTAYSTGETPVMVGKWRIKTLAGSATN